MAVVVEHAFTMLQPWCTHEHRLTPNWEYIPNTPLPHPFCRISQNYLLVFDTSQESCAYPWTDHQGVWDRSTPRTKEDLINMVDMGTTNSTSPPQETREKKWQVSCSVNAYRRECYAACGRGRQLFSGEGAKLIRRVEQ